MVMVTLLYSFWHSDDGCQVGAMGAVRPMSRALEPAV